MMSQAIRAGRRAAEKRMVDAVKITRITGVKLNPTTLVEEPVRKVIYAGKAELKSFEPFEQTPDIPGGTVTVQRNRLSIPVDKGPAAIGDRVEVTAAALNAHLVGNTYRVASRLAKTHATAQRLAIDEVP